MGPMNMKSIRWESVKAIFHAIAASDQVSRAQIAEQTGLSLVTVGKVADTLLEMGMLTQEKQVRSTAGRRAGLLQIHPDRFALNLDLSCLPFRFSILDLRLGLREKVRRPSGSVDSVIEELHSFLEEALTHLVEHYDLSNCFGIGVSLPGRYDAASDRICTPRIPGLEDVAIREEVEKVFTGFPLFLEASENAAALSHIASLDHAEDKNILYWFLGEETTTGAFLAGGRFLHGQSQPCQFGELLLPGGQRLGEALRQAQTPAEIVSVVAVPLYNTLCLLAPDTVILDCERLRTAPEERETMLSLLLDTMRSASGGGGGGRGRDDSPPNIQITCAKFRHAHRGLTMQLRQMWLYRALEEPD